MMISSALLAVLLALPASANDLGESLRFDGAAAARVNSVQPGGSGRVFFDTGESDPPLASYDTVLLHGVMPDEGLRLEVAVPALGGLWHTWQPAEVKRFPNGRFWARYKFAGPGRASVRLRAVDAGVRSAHTFALYDAELFVEGGEAGVETQAPKPAVKEAGAGGTYRFVARKDWGAKPPKQDYTTHSPVRFTMHHTAGSRPKTYEDAVQEMQFIQDFHMNGRGWNDIGYHFVISPTGHVFEGRPEGVVGAHVLNHNTGNLGASFMGNHHPPTSDQPAAEALDAFVALGRRLVQDYKIPAAEIQAHRDLGQSDCPGDILYAKLPELKALITGQAAPPSVGIPRVPKGDFQAEAYLKTLSW